MLKTTATIEQIGKEVVDFLSSSINVDMVLLFGSYAQGNFRKDSDFDMAVISEDLVKMGILEKMELFCKIALAVDSRVEVKGFGKSEFLNPRKGSLLEMIKKQGKILYSRR